eukprot:SAG11_NODE_213_length_12262_cov_8.391597_4_plen_153_part_00
MIYEQRQFYPNTYRIVHTVIALRALIYEYREYMKCTYDMGCIPLVMREHVEAVLEETIVDLSGYFAPGLHKLLAAVLGCNKREDSKHPAVKCFWKDNPDDASARSLDEESVQSEAQHTALGKAKIDEDDSFTNPLSSKGLDPLTRSSDGDEL